MRNYQNGCTIFALPSTIDENSCCFTPQHLMSLVFWVLAILTGVYWYLIIFYISIFLMTCDVEHLFICLFAICISSLVMCLLRFLAHFLIGFFVFLLLSSKCSLYSLDTSPLPDVSFANAFFQSVAYFLHLQTLSFAEHKFLILMTISYFLQGSDP